MKTPVMQSCPILELMNISIETRKKIFGHKQSKNIKNRVHFPQGLAIGKTDMVLY